MTSPAPPLALVVDDEALNRTIAQAVLTRAGWRVTLATGGREALEQVGARPALVLMDLMMPEMDGYAALAAIRARTDGTASVPVIAYTSMRFEDPAPLFAAGFDDYLAKPCSPDVMIAAAARWWPGDGDAIPRLAATLGGDAIEGIVEGFRAMLVEALAALGSDEAAGVAHRVAGIAGTLGFAALGRHWLALSEGQPVDPADLRRGTRRAIAEIDRGF